MRVSQTTAVNKKAWEYLILTRFRGDIYKVPTIKEIRELLKKVKEKTLSRKSKENYRPAPLPALSPFVIGYPIIKQDWHNESFDTKEKNTLKEIRKAGL